VPHLADNEEAKAMPLQQQANSQIAPEMTKSNLCSKSIYSMVG